MLFFSSREACHSKSDKETIGCGSIDGGEGVREC